MNLICQDAVRNRGSWRPGIPPSILHCSRNERRRIGDTKRYTPSGLYKEVSCLQRLLVDLWLSNPYVAVNLISVDSLLQDSWTCLLPAPWFDPRLLNGLACSALLCMILAYPPGHACLCLHLVPDLGFELATLLASNLPETCYLPRVPHASSYCSSASSKYLNILPDNAPVGTSSQAVPAGDLCFFEASTSCLATREVLSSFSLQPGMW